MASIRTFVRDLVEVFVEHEMPEKFLVPGGLSALDIRLDAHEPMSREMICRGYQGLADYLSKITGEEVVVFISAPAEMKGNGRDIAWMVIDQFEAWRRAREERGCQDNVYRHSACQAFVAGLLGDNEEEVEDQDRELTREEEIRLMDSMYGIILNDRDMCAVYRAALDAHSGQDDFQSIFSMLIVAVVLQMKEPITLPILKRVAQRAETEFVTHAARSAASTGVRPD